MNEKESGADAPEPTKKNKEGKKKNRIDPHKQYAWMEKIQKLQPFISDKPFRVAKRDSKGKPTIQKPLEEVTVHWFPVSDHDIPPQLIIFEFDHKDQNQNYVNSKRIEDFLKGKNLAFLKNEYGGRSPHLWIFLQPPDKTSENAMRGIRERVARWILKECEIDIEESGFDMANITHSRHLIRAFTVTEDFPEKIEFWNITDDMLRVIIGGAVEGNFSNLSNSTNFSNFSNFSDSNLQENLELLNTPDSIYSNLNQGVHADIWYFGKLIKYRNGLREMVVTSERGMFVNKSEGIIKGIPIGCNEITEVLGIEYQNSLEETKNFWSNQSIRGWIQGKSNQPTKEDVFTKIRQTILKYMDLQDDAEADVVTCFIFGTYCYELFESYPILFLNARRESGKSKLKRLIRLLSFHGEEASNISEASFFRSIEATKGSLCIDEYEHMDSDRKKITDQLLNAGIEKGSSVKRVEKVKGVLRNRSFDVFAPKVVCNIGGLNQVTLSRCILIRLMRTLTTKGNLRPRERSKRWQEIRDSCHIIVMEHWRDIQKIYNEHNSKHIRNRKEDVWKPLLSVAKFFGPGVYQRIDSYSKQSIKDTVVDVYESDWEFQLLEVLRENIQEEGWYPVKDIVYWLNLKLGVEKPPRDRWVGGQLKRNFIFRQRYNPTSQYFMSPELIDDRFRRLYGELKGDEDNAETGSKRATKVTKETKVTKATSPSIGGNSKITHIDMKEDPDPITEFEKEQQEAPEIEEPNPEGIPSHPIVKKDKAKQEGKSLGGEEEERRKEALAWEREETKAWSEG